MAPFIAEEYSHTTPATSRTNEQRHLGDITIDLATRRVTKAGEHVMLSHREFDVLDYLSARRGETVSHIDLFEHLDDALETPISSMVDVHVFYLRKKLGQELILSHRGKGYTIPR